MKFSLKLFLWTLLIVAITLAFGGYYIINSLFKSSIDREVKQSLDENQMIRFALETAALSIPLKYDYIQDETITQISATLNDQKRVIKVSDENKNMLYETGKFKSILDDVSEKMQTYQIIILNNKYFVQTAIKVNLNNRFVYLETLRDITNVFDDRDNGFLVYKQVCVIILLCESIIIFLLSRWLTKPINLLSNATMKMSKGIYNYRAKKISDDELGKLTEDFNHMAFVLESHVKQLQQSVKLQEEFVAAFSHELKTPLTSIIGYADILRSQKMDEEKQLISANYIFNEGKRLEKLSFDLLDIIVLKHLEKPSTIFNANTVFKYIKDTYLDLNIVYNFKDAYVVGDISLIKTLLINLIDNAVKSSDINSQIYLIGECLNDKYIFSVKDNGCGILPEHLNKITEAFYMIDKSRTKHGAGLGLTLCSQIANLHGTSLNIESIFGTGTSVKFDLQICTQKN